MGGQRQALPPSRTQQKATLHKLHEQEREVSQMLTALRMALSIDARLRLRSTHLQRASENPASE